MPRRLLLTIAATAACVFGGAATASAAPYSLLQINLCGSGLAPCFGMSTPDKAGKAAELILARRPSVVTLNEMCLKDLAGISAATRGYRGAFSQSGTQRCKNGQPYGNGVMFAPGVRTGAIRRTSYGAQQGEQAQQMENVLAGHVRAGVPTLLGGDWNLKFGGRPNAQDFVPSGMYRKGDGDVQHVLATQGHFRFVSTRTMRLNWTDHPGFQVYFDKR